MIDLLGKTRDIRAKINRGQGLLNYHLFNQHDIQTKQKKIDVDPAVLNAIVFDQKPKRVYKTNSSGNLAFNDAKRVHTALREFNDMSANAAFQKILA